MISTFHDLKAKEQTEVVIKGTKNYKIIKEVYNSRQLPLENPDEAVYKWCS